MLRRPRLLKRFVPRLETLEQRHLLSSLPVAPPLPQTADAGFPALDAASKDAARIIAEGNANGQLAVVGVLDQAAAAGVLVRPPNHSPTAVATIYNYSSATQTFSAGVPLQTQVPAGPDVNIAFGDVNNDGIPDLAVAGPDGHGSIVVQLFTSIQVQMPGTTTTGWQFTPGEVFRQDFGQVQANKRTEALALTDVNGDHIPDVVITSDTQIAVLLAGAVKGSTGVVTYDYTALPVVPSPFLPFETKQDTSDGAAKGQAGDVIVRGWDPDNKQALVTEADGQILFTSMTVTGPGQGTAGSVSFGPVDSIAILPSGVSSATPATPTTNGGAVVQQVGPLKWMAPELLAITGLHADGSPDLLAEIGDKLYVGTGNETSSTGTAGLSFTWSTQAVPPQLIGRPLFLSSVDGDPSDDRELFAVTFTQQGSTATPTGVDILLYIDEDEREDDGTEEGNDRADVSATQ